MGIDAQTIQRTTNTDGVTIGENAGGELEISGTYIAKVNDLNSEQSLNILINSAAASSTLNDYEDMFLDIFSDADGNDNTVDIENTTAAFSTDKYDNIAADFPFNSGFTLDTTSAETNLGGYNISVDNTCELKSVTKSAECNATTAYLRSTPTGVDIATATIVGNTAIFSPTQTLTQGQNYSIMVGSGGSSYTRDLETSISYPVNGSYINLTGGIFSNNDTPQSTVAMNIDSITITSTTANRIVQTNAQAITANPTGHQVYSHNTLAGTGNITYDISFDGGTTWVTGQSLNTKNTSVHAGSSMKIKLNLNGTGSGNTSSAKDYAIMLYY